MSTDGEVKCVLQGTFNLPEDATSQTFQIRVEKFMQAAGQGPDYLFAVPAGEDVETPQKSGSDSQASASRRGPSSRSVAPNSSLDNIAKSTLGDEEFTETQIGHSAVGNAKENAKRLRRDPAIAPKLNKDP